MADPMLALIGAITLAILGLGAILALLFMSAQMFYSAFQWLNGFTSWLFLSEGDYIRWRLDQDRKRQS